MMVIFSRSMGGIITPSSYPDIFPTKGREKNLSQIDNRDSISFWSISQRHGSYLDICSLTSQFFKNLLRISSLNTFTIINLF